MSICTAPLQTMPPPTLSYWQLWVCIVSCRSPLFPKIVIFTSSSKLASLPLKSVTFDASTVKIFWIPSPLENVSPLDSRATSCGAGGGAFCRSL